MSKASKDNGFLQLANELAAQFASRAFTGQQLAILFVVMRFTYGYQADAYAYTAAQVAEHTGIDPSDVRKHIKALLAAGVLREKAEGVGINPNLDQWEIPPRKEGKFPCPKQGKFPRATGEIPPEKQGKSPCMVAQKSAQDATSAEPKEKKESIKETLPPKGVSQVEGVAPRFSGLAAIANEAEWVEGEQARFLKLVNLSKVKDLGLLQGKTAEQVKVYLAFSTEYRATGWAYLEDRKASEPALPPPPKGYTLFTLVDYLQDPSKYPAVARKQPALTDEDLAAAQPAPDNPWKDKPYWRMFDPRFVDAVRPGPEGQMSYILTTIGNRYGEEVWGQVAGLHRSKGLDAAMARIVPLWFNQAHTLKGAANG